ncbi:MAG: ABC transporter ATP-binding protein [Clostridia bacterium]|nr:ABC transporter ATP-binding protein [Clostridia bacterium]
MEEILKVSGITKTFKLSAKQRKINKTSERYLTAVNDLSFSAYKGEIFGLLGPNGAGKTTTLRIISTLIKADSGEITIDGVDARRDPDEARKKIGFLTSELKLEDFFTPDYLYGYFSALHGVPEEKAAERKRFMFGKFGIDKFAEVRIGDLSTGMKQKVSLVISLVHDPDIIIFDEPTNGLDVITAKTVTDFLIELKNSGKTILLSTHIFSLVEKLCDRVGIIVAGKMTACGKLSNITAEKPLEEVFFDIYKKEVGENE